MQQQQQEELTKHQHTTTTMPKKQSFDEILAEATSKDIALEGVGNWGIFGFVSVFCVVLPGYLFTTPMIGMELEKNAALYGAVTLVSAVFLTYASKRVADGMFNSESSRYSEEMQKLASQRAVGFSMFKNNVMYLFFTLFLAFWFIPTFTANDKIRFALSVTTPAFTMAYLSTYSK